MIQNDMLIFENIDFGEIRTLQIDGAPWFVGKDVADILGYANSRKALSDHVDEDDKLTYRFVTSGQNRRMTLINESGLYSLILSSKLPTAKAFKRWVTSEVLPSIRKHGAYIHEDILEQMRNSSEFANELIRRLAKEREKNEVLQYFLDAAAPKIRYHDIILQCPNPVQVTIIAKDYGMSAVKFNKLLHCLGVQFKMGKTWLLYSKYAGNGYTVTKTYITDGEIASIHTLFTQKGRRFLYDFLAGYGILPQSEVIGAGS